MNKTYYLFDPSVMQHKDNALKFTTMEDNGEGNVHEGQPRYLPGENISEFYAFGSLNANSVLCNFLEQNDIAVHFFDYYEIYVGSFMPLGVLLSGKMLLTQTSAYQNRKKRLEIARKFVEGGAFNMLKNLRYYNMRGKELDDSIVRIKQLASTLPFVGPVDELVGLEGNIRQAYYKGFD